jgi:hypothetical protein
MENMVPKSIKTLFSFRYGVIIFALIIWSGVCGSRASTVWAQPVMYPANLEQFLAQDARMQKEAVALALKGRHAEAADKLEQIADRDLKMAAHSPPTLKRTFERSAARCRHLAESMRRQ